MTGWELGLYVLTAILALISVASLAAATPRPAPTEETRRRPAPAPPRRAA